MIVAEKLVKKFMNGDKEQTVLHEVNCSIPEGDFVAIMGPSGAGKSTFLYQMSLLDHPTSGKVVLNGVDTSALDSVERTRFRLEYLGFVFQDYALLPELTARENVMVPMLMQGLSQREARMIADEALTKVDLAHRLTNLPSQLSGGEQQRVSVARAIARKPKILYADEPTASLDTERSVEIIQLLQTLNEKDGLTIVMVTHEPEYARMAKRLIEFRDGRIVKDGAI